MSPFFGVQVLHVAFATLGEGRALKTAAKVLAGKGRLRSCGKSNKCPAGLLEVLEHAMTNAGPTSTDSTTERAEKAESQPSLVAVSEENLAALLRATSDAPEPEVQQVAPLAEVEAKGTPVVDEPVASAPVEEAVAAERCRNRRHNRSTLPRVFRRRRRRFKSRFLRHSRLSRQRPQQCRRRRGTDWQRAGSWAP